MDVVNRRIGHGRRIDHRHIISERIFDTSPCGDVVLDLFGQHVDLQIGNAPLTAE